MEKLITFASVDDDAMIKSVMEHLRSFNFCLEHCWHAFNSENAIKNFVERPVDVVVADYRLKAENGVELIKTIKTIRKETKFVLLSGHLNPQACHSAMVLGVSSILVKGEPLPFVAKAVIDAIREKPIFSEQVKLIAVGAKDNPKISEKERLILDLYTKFQTVKRVSIEIGENQKTIETLLRRVRIRLGSMEKPLPTKQLLHRFMNGELC